MPCDSPVTVYSKGRDILVPCGKCPGCKIRRVNEWVFRIMWEEEHNSVASHFITLTYDTAHVPLTKNGFMSLRKKDFQKFMKRLRKLCVDDPPLRYFACGEYGSTFNRPHYHAIVLNCTDSERYADAWSLGGVQFGSVHIGTATGDSVAYCLKYIDKQSVGVKGNRHFRDDREPEFQLQSKGLGAGYCDAPGIRQYHRADLTRNFLSKRGGYRVAMPRYYRTRIFTSDELEAQRDIIGDAIQKNEDIAIRDFTTKPPLGYEFRSDYVDALKKERRRKFGESVKKRSQF